MNFLFFVCGILLGLTFALVQAGPCTPDQWEGYEDSIGGYVYHRRPGIIRESTRVSYDAKNKRVASFVNYVNNDYENKFQIVMRYDDDKDDGGKIYVVDLKKDKCWSKKLEFPFPKACIPDDGKALGEYYMGLQGKGGFLVAGYEVEKKGMTSFITVSKAGDKIIPVGETVYGTIMKSSFVQPMAYIGITAGIKNATVFDIPAQCKEFAGTSVADYLLRQHLILGF